MGLSRDFDRVTIEDDGSTVRVEATTSDEGGKPIAPDPATRILITLIALPDGDVTLTAEPEMPVVESSWPVRFENAAAQLEGVDNVLCIGVALGGEGSPYVWTEQRPLALK